MGLTPPPIRVTFDRLSRNHNVPPLDLPIERGDHIADDIAELVYYEARKHCVSRDLEVIVDLDQLAGTVYAGFRVAGHFRIEGL